MQQDHSPDDDMALFADVSRYIADRRYVRVDGKPLFVVYRPGLLPDMSATIKRWRKAARDSGIGEIMIGAVVSFGYTAAATDGFDLEIEFPPHNLNNLRQVTGEIMKDNDAFAGHVFSYDSYVEETMKPQGERDCSLVRGVMPQWDNTARRGNRATIFHGASPIKFQRLFEQVVVSVLSKPTSMKQMVIVNAWNEWAEGTYMEPDASWGHAFINAANRALTGCRYGRIAVLGDRSGQERSQLCEVDWIDLSESALQGGEGDTSAGTFLGAVLSLGERLLDYDLVVFGTSASRIASHKEAEKAAHAFYLDEDLGLVANRDETVAPINNPVEDLLLAELGAQTGLNLNGLSPAARAPISYVGIVARSGILRPFIRKAPSITAQWCRDETRTAFLNAAISAAARAAGFKVQC